MVGYEIFNAYEIRARIFPSLIILLPIVVLFFSIIPLSNPIEKILIGFGIFFVLVYAFSYQVRICGTKIQEKCWSNAGSPPSTLILQWENQVLSKDLKNQIYSTILKKYAIAIPDSIEQEKNLAEFNRIIDNVFFRVRSDLYKKNPEGIWSKHNAEYGFVRNLFGCREIWVTISIICSIIGGFAYYYQQDNVILLGIFINCSCIIISLFAGWRSLPPSFEERGIQYAKSAWGAFLSENT